MVVSKVVDVKVGRFAPTNMCGYLTDVVFTEFVDMDQIHYSDLCFLLAIAVQLSDD